MGLLSDSQNHLPHLTEPLARGAALHVGHVRRHVHELHARQRMLRICMLDCDRDRIVCPTRTPPSRPQPRSFASRPADSTIHVAARSGLVTTTTRKRRLFLSPLNFPLPEPQWLYLFMKTTLRLESIRSPPTLVSLSGRPVFGSLRVRSATACLWSVQITPSTLRSVSPTEIPALNTSPWVTTFSTCDVRAGFHAWQSVAVRCSQRLLAISGCTAP